MKATLDQPYLLDKTSVHELVREIALLIPDENLTIVLPDLFNILGDYYFVGEQRITFEFREEPSLRYEIRNYTVYVVLFYADSAFADQDRITTTLSNVTDKFNALHRSNIVVDHRKVGMTYITKGENK